MEKIENVSNPQVGKFYLVKCAKITGNDLVMGSMLFSNKVIPLVADAHLDNEIIKFKHVHYHIDWRFVDKATYDMCTDEFLYKGRELSLVVSPDDFVWKEYRARKYKRDFSPYPDMRAGWLPELEAAFSNKMLSKSLVCPHQGGQLKSCRHKDSIVTCPLHGLQWDVTTRKLVPRT